jgi:hypothetical protein
MSKPSTVELSSLARVLPPRHLKAALLEAIDEIQDIETDTIIRNIVHRAADIALSPKEDK